MKTEEEDPRRNQSCRYFDSTLLACRTETINLGCFKAPSLWLFVKAAVGNESMRAEPC